jgi:hypothetical protein
MVKVMSPLACLLRLTTRFAGWPTSSRVVVRHRSSGWFVAPEGATDDADAAVQFDNEDVAHEFVETYTCEPMGFEVVAADEAERAA